MTFMANKNSLIILKWSVSIYAVENMLAQVKPFKKLLT